MSTSIYLERPDDETLLVRIEEDVVASVNHDEHGWSGMSAVENVVREIADAFGIEVYES